MSNIALDTNDCEIGLTSMPNLQTYDADHRELNIYFDHRKTTKMRV